MKKRLFLVLLLITAVILTVILCWPAPYAEEWQFCEEFFAARSRTDTFADVASYIHYEDKAFYNMMEHDHSRLISYDLLKGWMVNENLAVFHLKLLVGYTDREETKYVYYFVGKIDGEYRMMLSQRNVPQELREGLDPADFSVSGNPLDLDEDLVFPLG